MRAGVRSFIPVAVLAIVLVPSALSSLLAQARIAPALTSVTALTGQVSSSEEGLMEGVILSAKKAGSTRTISVVSDQQGRYRFPRARLEPGAKGYEPEAHSSGIRHG